MLRVPECGICVRVYVCVCVRKGTYEYVCVCMFVCVCVCVWCVFAGCIDMAVLFDMLV